MTVPITNIVEIKSDNYIAQYKKLSDIIERYSSKLHLEEKRNNALNRASAIQ